MSFELTLDLIFSWCPNWLDYLEGEAEKRPKAENKGRSEDPSDLPYENLPFRGLRDPPKKVEHLHPANKTLFIALFLVVYGWVQLSEYANS